MSENLEKRIVELEKRVKELENLLAAGAKPEEKEYIVGRKINNNFTTCYYKTSKDRVLETNNHRNSIDSSDKTVWKNNIKSVLINLGKEDLLKGDTDNDYQECAITLFAKYGKNGYALFDNGIIISSNGGTATARQSSKNIKF